MTRIKRPFAATGAAVLLALSLSACGGAPTDASTSEFCEVINDDSALEGIDPENPDEEAFVDAVKEQADRIEEVGTPEDISDEAREGFEIQLDAIKDLDADDIDFESDEDPLADQLSDDDKEKVDAFTEYQSETCAEEGTE